MYRTQSDKSIFSPIKIGNLELSNRLVMAPMAVHLTPTTGELNELTKRYFLERAKGAETKLKRFDMHVLALGLRSKNELKSALNDFECECHIIGDAKEPRRGTDAILEGARLGNMV
jgi:hypothetical protein